MKKKIIGILVCMTLMIPALSVTAIANEPPTAPDIDGPTSGKPGVEYPYNLCSTDPDGDDIFYCIDWGDGSGEVCIGPYPSGVCPPPVSHTWSEQGIYIIKAKAKDTHDAESEWSTLEVTMPKSKRTPTTTTHGLFEAEMGRRGNSDPLVSLSGTYRLRDRFIVFGGTATSGDKTGRFRGAFRNNHFIIKTFIGGRNIVIFGRCVFDDTHTSFTGGWVGRGLPIRGWITGTLTPS